MPPFSEKRMHVRKRISTNVELAIWRTSGEDSIICNTKDISAGGAFLNTGDLSKTKAVPIHMHLLHQKEKHNPIYLKIIRKTPEGLAVEFKSLGINEFAAVQEILS